MQVPRKTRIRQR